MHIKLLCAVATVCLLLCVPAQADLTTTASPPQRSAISVVSPSPPSPSPKKAAVTFKAYSAVYTSRKRGMTFTTHRQLEDLGKGIFQLSMHTDSFLINIEETSRFRFNQQFPDGTLLPLIYKYKRRGIGKSEAQKFSFDWQKKQAVATADDNSRVIPLKDGTLDKLSYQYQLRRDLLSGDQFTQRAYAIPKRGSIRHYQLQWLGEETIETPLGLFDTIKLRQFRKGKTRETFFWLAKDWDYFLIKVQHHENGNDGNEMTLAKGVLGNKPIRGKPAA